MFEEFRKIDKKTLDLKPKPKIQNSKLKTPTPMKTLKTLQSKPPKKNHNPKVCPNLKPQSPIANPLKLQIPKPKGPNAKMPHLPTA